ncbi:MULTISPECIES: acyl-ACP--UDP-N-acetylglucosamine O-acyltransferase [unclassified Meiothermus]|uniref:acyl-ACP--UDP-N-acetylglucosamine O-acyltransferase n=1 Tax=unclassified Meiothermus TaxID=370471 RepID=UPI000D7CE9F4|nr:MULTISPECIES: acyl-ACP--UDP-N-acetylglucosamine O-acyltransferase [unclassified Meiothermus]PZA06693.1 acyl-[acyl-carrier-protein]--UDP-N-acetylglucosamine O-acyltransferase [Meiothermus sp. Pnk-1]RYM36619.1 acyl-ACP--UDP-N-acetylglucosamine O-acyltransferase [Meiothermus sp. PNK-Is4]
MVEAKIHPTAIVSPRAQLGLGVEIGPYCVVEGPCVLGGGVVLEPHVVIRPYVRLGEGVRVASYAVLGGEPQDLGFKGQETWLEVGERTVIREGVSLHRSTREDRPTRIGAGCYLMAHSHVAHDCQVGDGVVLTNAVNLAGHVEVGERAVLGGMTGVHQFVRIGAYAMVGGASKVSQDILPFTLADGRPARHYRLNTVGLRRNGIGGERYRALEQAFRALREGNFPDGLPQTEEILRLCAFVEAPSKRGIAAFARWGEE